MLSIKFDTQGPIAQIDALIKGLEQLDQSIYADIGDLLLRSIDARFEAGGKPPWKRLAESTLASRRRRGRGFKILIDSGQLRSSMRKEVGPNYVRVGTAVPYAVYPQSTRPFIYFSREDLINIEALVIRRIKKQAGLVN